MTAPQRPEREKRLDVIPSAWALVLMIGRMRLVIHRALLDTVLVALLDWRCRFDTADAFELARGRYIVIVEACDEASTD